MPAGDKDRTFFDYLMCAEDTDRSPMGALPVEALFDDLAVSGLLFPLNRWTKPRWQAQHPSVQSSLCVADLRDMTIQGEHRSVIMRVWADGMRLVVGGRYRISPRYVDFNINKILASLVEHDLRMSSVDGGDNNIEDSPFLQLIVDPRGFSRSPIGNHEKEDLLREERIIQRLFRELGGLGVADAASLVLKDSQREAMRRILTGRLAVVWGPPGAVPSLDHAHGANNAAGTGKTYTLALSLLRLIDVERRLKNRERIVVYLSCVTHAAIEACLKKLQFLMGCIQRIESYEKGWLNRLRVEHVLKGGEHPGPSKQGGEDETIIYAGTVYQVLFFELYLSRSTFLTRCTVVQLLEEEPRPRSGLFDPRRSWSIIPQCCLSCVQKSPFECKSCHCRRFGTARTNSCWILSQHSPIATTVWKYTGLHHV